MNLVYNEETYINCYWLLCFADIRGVTTFSIVGYDIRLWLYLPNYSNTAQSRTLTSLQWPLPALSKIFSGMTHSIRKQRDQIHSRYDAICTLKKRLTCAIESITAVPICTCAVEVTHCIVTYSKGTACISCNSTFIYICNGHITIQNWTRKRAKSCSEILNLQFW